MFLIAVRGVLTKQCIGGINDKFDAIAVGISIIIILNFCQILSKIGTISLENQNNDALFLAEKFV